MRTLADKTQFIVITHRRGTMEAADVLYGVTMQEQGVSKILTINLNDMAKELQHQIRRSHYGNGLFQISKKQAFTAVPTFDDLNDEFYDSLEEALILADVGAETACDIVAQLRKAGERSALSAVWRR